MERDEILRILAEHRAEILQHDVKSLALFGSAACGEARADSDVDLLVEFNKAVGLFEFVRLQGYLEGILGRSVDLTTINALRPRMREEILREAVYAA